MKVKQRSKGGYVYLGEERCKQKGGWGWGQRASEIKEENAARSRSCKASKVFLLFIISEMKRHHRVWTEEWPIRTCGKSPFRCCLENAILGTNLRFLFFSLKKLSFNWVSCIFWWIWQLYLGGHQDYPGNRWSDTDQSESCEVMRHGQKLGVFGRKSQLNLLINWI